MKTLIVVDAQNDFFPGGALPVNTAAKIVPTVTQLLDKMDLVVWTKDWHPNCHCSFKENGGPWPAHCVQGSEGARIVPALEALIHLGGDGPYIVNKGKSHDADSYSAFYDDNGITTGLTDFLRNKGADLLHICGVATEYCVKFTALDAIKDGFSVALIEQGIAGLGEESSQKAIDEVLEAGGILVTDIGR